MPGTLYRDSNHRVIWMEMLYKFIWGSFIERKMYVYMKLQIVMGVATKENRNSRHWDGYLLLELGSRWWALAHHHHPPALLPRLRFWPCWGMAMAPVEVKKLPEVLTREKLPTGHWRTRNFPLTGWSTHTRGPSPGMLPNSLGILLDTSQEASCRKYCWINCAASKETCGTGSCCCWNVGPWLSHTPAEHSLQQQGHSDTHGTKPPLFLQGPSRGKVSWLKGSAYGAQLQDHKQDNEEHIWNQEAKSWYLVYP